MRMNAPLELMVAMPTPLVQILMAPIRVHAMMGMQALDFIALWVSVALKAPLDLEMILEVFGI